MFEKVIEFIQLLRSRGIRISIAETQDALDALTLSSRFMRDSRAFKQVLSSTLIKNQRDTPLFNVIFQQFFFGRAESKFDDFLQQMNEHVEFLDQDPGESDSFQILENALEESIAGLAAGKSLPDEEDNGMQDDEGKQQKVANTNSRQKGSFSQLFSHLRRDEIMKLDEEEFLRHELELRKLITELGRKIASKLTSRYARGKNVVDFRKTIHQNIKHGGALIKIEQKKKKIARPRLIGLIDISDSCQMYYFFMFYLIFLIKKEFSHVRIYEFDSDLLEITPALEKDSMQEAREEILKIWNKSETFKMRNFMRTHSNYDTVLEQFMKKIGPILTKKTTILILGDCRDYLGVRTKNCEPEFCFRGCKFHVPEARCEEQDRNCQFCSCRQINNFPRSALHLRELVKKAKQVIIFNPEKQTFWNIGDSVAYCYKNVGAEVYSVNDIETLAELVYNQL
ncbi:MAG: VWA domain-containing protein [Candidatus Helarchaeales archaeon]